MISKSLIVFGTGQQSEIISFYLKRQSRKVKFYCVDDKYFKKNKFQGINVISTSELLKKFKPQNYNLHIAISYSELNSLRSSKYNFFKKKGYKFENVTHNIGGHFVTSGTGAFERFVAPVAGNYYFATMPGYLQAGVNHATRIAVNGSEMSELSRFIQGSAGSHCAFGASIMLRLAANDYVTIHPQYTPYHLNTNTCYFCGMLVG